MKLQFEYKYNTYLVDVTNVALCLTNFIYVQVDNDVIKVEYELDENGIPFNARRVGTLMLNNATLVDKDELAFHKLLEEYNLTDNKQTRKLWNKCYELDRHCSGLESVISNWHSIVDLIID